MSVGVTSVMVEGEGVAAAAAAAAAPSCREWVGDPRALAPPPHSPPFPRPGEGEGDPGEQQGRPWSREGEGEGTCCQLQERLEGN